MRRKRETSLLASNVTKLLDDVMENYEKEFRPGFEKGKPTKVWIDLDIRTMGPVSDLSYTYAFNCYFRQQWIDTRLRFNNSNVPQQNELCLSMAMLDKIWKPDSYFWNGANSYIHAMTSSNRLVRLRPDGTILYSSRITVQGRCSMVMDRYPLDQQACRLVIGSYSYRPIFGTGSSILLSSALQLLCDEFLCALYFDRFAMLGSVLHKSRSNRQ
ncbi:hypothetical protein WR25_19889 isoform B [Diploscapter pachys]|uniref:Neurotransmitter-gated ion-channel ligand-binding domain-containing protein n=1 Tax=Diploscapter pachys TaxID=2018661 RepID=A0A2A2LBV2_9BILA|nr:hypothetical protein WR25_19889 isoform A [Diploscapter pachys]PAV83528.1 hypothetical protein WR25_19889 isoform B [Diploscapter pachys]